MAILKLILLTLFIGLSYSQCGIGCLICNQSNQCTLCDVTNRYYLKGTTCAIYTHDNCEVLTMTGECALCKKDTYLDPITNICIPVPVEKKIDNCEYYSTYLTCSLCATNYYAYYGTCKVVSSATANCHYY